MWVSGGRGAESVVSFDDVSFGDFSDVRRHVRDVVRSNSEFFETWAHPCCRRKVTVAERAIPPFHESQSAFLRLVKVRCGG